MGTRYPSSFLNSYGLPWTHVPGGQEAQGQAVHRLPVGNVGILADPELSLLFLPMEEAAGK